MNAAGEPLGNHRYSSMSRYVFDRQHIYDVVETASRLKLTLIPILDVNKQFLGVITQQDLLQRFNKLITTHTPNGILQIKIKIHNYTLSKITQIVEDADGKILSLY